MEVNININVEVEKILCYIEKLFSSPHSLLKESQKAKAAKIYRKMAAEIYSNLLFLDKFNYDTIKSKTINSPEIKRIITKDLKITNTEQFITYTKKFPQLKEQDKKNIIANLALALYKINAIRSFAAKSDKELKRFKGFRPAFRLKNIRSVYITIKQSLK
ncbi:hypothetical protein FACS1894147_12610 [Spirochaetia bacterium]|nr:hypothetical protein FACS1894147_12610 [Spirochaetia bacterium]